MEIFASRVRTAYIKKRSKRSMALATLLITLVMGACSFAARQDEKDLQAVSAEFSPALRKSVVSTWAGADISAMAASPSDGGR